MGKGAQQLTSPAVKDAAAKDVLIHGQLYDERKVARDEVTVHSGGRNW